MIVCSEMDLDKELSEILRATQEPTFPEAAEEARRSLLVEPLAEAGPIDVTLRAKYRSRIHELSASLLALGSRIKLFEAENERLRRRNAALSGVPLMRPAKL